MLNIPDILLMIIFLGIIIVSILIMWIHQMKLNSKIQFDDILNLPMTKKLFKKTDCVYIPCYRVYGTQFETPVMFMIDTGATSNFISEKFLQEVYPDYIKHILLGDDVMSINGTVTLNKLTNVKLSLMNVNCEDEFSILDTQESLDYLSEECGYRIVGILGTGFLQKFRCKLNFDNV